MMVDKRSFTRAEQAKQNGAEQGEAKWSRIRGAERSRTNEAERNGAEEIGAKRSGGELE